MPKKNTKKISQDTCHCQRQLAARSNKRTTLVTTDSSTDTHTYDKEASKQFSSIEIQLEPSRIVQDLGKKEKRSAPSLSPLERFQEYFNESKHTKQQSTRPTGRTTRTRESLRSAQRTHNGSHARAGRSQRKKKQGSMRHGSIHLLTTATVVQTRGC